MTLVAVWTTRETKDYLQTRLAGKRNLAESTVRRWAAARIIPANRGHDWRWYFEPELIMRWVQGGPLMHRFHLAKNPRLALTQIRELIAYLCRPVNQEGNPFYATQQENLVTAVRMVFLKTDYHKIRPAVRDLCERFRMNPGLACLEEVPGVFK